MLGRSQSLPGLMPGQEVAYANAVNNLNRPIPNPPFQGLFMLLILLIQYYNLFYITL